MPSKDEQGDVHGGLLVGQPARDGAEAVSVLEWAGADAAGERAAQRLGGAEAGGAGDRRRRRGRSSRAAGARPRRARVSTYAAGVQPTSSRNTRAKWRGLIATRAASRSTRVVVVGMLGDPAPAARASGSRSAICAPSCALNCDWPPGRCTNSTSWRAVMQRDVAAEVVVDEREREVHARGHAGRRPHVAVAHEDRIGVDGHVGIAGARGRSHARQCVVARRPSSTPGGREQERAGAHRRDPAAAAPRRAPIHATSARSCDAAHRAVAADDDQRVDRTAHRRAATGRRRSSARGPVRSGRRGRDRDTCRRARRSVMS